MARSGSVVISFLGVAMLLLLAVPVPCVNATMNCGEVASDLSPCLGYVTGREALMQSCCDGVRRLNTDAQTTPDRQTACNCLKTIAAATPAINASLAAGLPAKCGVSIPYAINPSTDCSKVR